jgi:Flp pilus assembly protein TadG
MFGLFLTGMLGVLGLAIDLGFAFSAKRTVQNAADAGAMAGARAVAKWTITNPYSASGDVSGIVNDINNRMSGSTHTLV